MNDARIADLERRLQTAEDRCATAERDLRFYKFERHQIAVELATARIRQRADARLASAEANG